MFRRAFIIFMVIGFGMGFLPRHLCAGDEFSTNVFFPLKKGSYWVYQGQTKWTSPGTSAVLEKTMTWKMLVEDVFRRGDCTVAVVNGHPQDLAWYEDGKSPGQYLIVQVNGKYYLIEGDERIHEVLARVQDQNDKLADLGYDWELFLEKPLAKYQSYGEESQLARDDRFYSWFVEDESTAELSQVKGQFPLGEIYKKYHLALRTLPDHIFFDFVPGIGITHYSYAHHGTVASTDLQLIEYFAG